MRLPPLGVNSAQMAVSIPETADRPWRLVDTQGPVGRGRVNLLIAQQPHETTVHRLSLGDVAREPEVRADLKIVKAPCASGCAIRQIDFVAHVCNRNLSWVLAPHRAKVVQWRGDWRPLRKAVDGEMGDVDRGIATVDERRGAQADRWCNLESCTAET